MNTDLVCPARDRLAIDQSKTAPAVFEALNNLKFGYGWIAGVMNSLFQPDFAGSLFTLAEERLIHLKFIGFRPSVRDRRIKLFDSMPID